MEEVLSLTTESAAGRPHAGERTDRVREVRVIDDTGRIGDYPPQQALTIAKQKGLDMVEIAATATPPVCRIMDFGRYQYQNRSGPAGQKHQKIIEVKEIKFVEGGRARLSFKKPIVRFLADGDKSGDDLLPRREMAHPEIGRRSESLIED